MKKTSLSSRNLFILLECKKIIFQKKIADISNHEALIVVDFAERFNTKARREIQASYFGKKQISLFTIKAYVKDKDYPFIIASDDNRQTKEVVYAYINRVINHL